MELIIKKLALQSLLDKAGSVVTGCSKEMLPVLKNFQLEATPNQLRVLATDQDLSVISTTKMVTVNEPGEVIIPAEMLRNLTKECGDVDITINVTGDLGKISTGKTKWDLRLMTEKYPSIPMPENIQWSAIPADKLSTAIKKVRNAAGNDSAKPEQTLIKFGALGVTATDGARLHHCNLPIPVEFELQAGAADLLLKILRATHSAVEESVHVAQTDSHILFQVANDVFLATKLNVKFPVVTAILNSVKSNVLYLQLSRQELLDGINRTRITADTETNKVGLSLVSNKLMLETKDKNGNSCSEQLEVHWPNAAKTFSVNWQALKSAISDMDNANVLLKFGEPVGARLAPVAIEEDGFVAVINQLRTVENAGTPAKT